MIKVLEYLSYECMLSQLGLLSLEKIRHQGDLTAGFQWLKEGYKKGEERLFTKARRDTTRC